MRAVVLIDELLYDPEDPHFIKRAPQSHFEAEYYVCDALRRLGGVEEPPLEPIVPAVEQFHYRNKLEYSFTATPSGPASA